MAQHADAGATTLLDGQVDRRRFLQMAATLSAAAGAGDMLFLARPAEALTTGQIPPDATELDADVQILMSVCQNCHSRCGIMARVKDGIVLKIDGNPYHPNNLGPDERPTYATPVDQAKRKPGRLCAKGLSSAKSFTHRLAISCCFRWPQMYSVGLSSGA